MILSANVAIIKTTPSNSFYATTAARVNNSISTRNLFPQASIILSSDKKIATITFKNISDFVRLSYKLTYNTDTLPQGIEGHVNLTGENELTREIILGTCSSGGICVYHVGVRDFDLKVYLDDINGNTINLSATL